MYAVGQQAGSWQSEALGPSFLSIGVRVKRPGLGKATEKSSKAALGAGADPREAGSTGKGTAGFSRHRGPPHATLGIPRAYPPGLGARAGAQEAHVTAGTSPCGLGGPWPVLHSRPQGPHLSNEANTLNLPSTALSWVGRGSVN